MLAAIKSLYKNVSSCVSVNGHVIDWFSVSTGLRQGCSLSSVLFNFYINDLAILLIYMNIGIDIVNEKVFFLLYADDIVLICENENDLQMMLNS
mgnify:CR=1 FL=1